MLKVERFYKKLLYILTGSLSIEGVIHNRALTLFGNVCWLSETSMGKTARRQLSVKGDNSFIWFIDFKSILLK